MTIRAMTLNDYDAVYDLWLHTEGMGLNDIDDSREGIARYLKRNPNTCFVATDGDVIIGSILSGHDGRRGFICHTAVDKSRRCEGVGRALVTAALDALKSEGISKVALVVFDRNETGNAFWEKLGFAVRKDLRYRDYLLRELKRIDV